MDAISDVRHAPRYRIYQVSLMAQRDAYGSLATILSLIRGKTHGTFIYFIFNYY